MTPLSLLTSVLALSQISSAALSQLNLQSDDSIKDVASTIAKDLMSFYTGNRAGDVPGNLPQPYYWWQCGAMFMTMINYWYYTGDTTYNDIVTQGMLWQVGPDSDYMTPNQTKTTGNDDQGFWAMAAMSAAEQKYPNPPDDKPQWLELAQAVFNTQAYRWDTQFCNGGLRWQVFTFNEGYNYKNTISNGVFFNLASRLALYTKNESYAEWADKVYDWTAASGFMTPTYGFYDGGHTTLNCSDVNKVQWTYNLGVFLHGTANMYAYSTDATQKAKWQSRLTGMVNATNIFFSTTAPNVLYEVACEPHGTCNTDNFSFKAYLTRWLAATTKLAPFTRDTIMPRLQASAKACVAQCQGGTTGTMCGMKWYENKYDGTTGVGQQMCALEIVSSNLIDNTPSIVSNATGGISRGNPAAGGISGGDSAQNLILDPITTKDRAGAGIVTTIVLLGLIGGMWWMLIN